MYEPCEPVTDHDAGLFDAVLKQHPPVFGLAEQRVIVGVCDPFAAQSVARSLDLRWPLGRHTG